jgi:hypothetical protein
MIQFWNISINKYLDFMLLYMQLYADLIKYTEYMGSMKKTSQKSLFTLISGSAHDACIY